MGPDPVDRPFRLGPACRVARGRALVEKQTEYAKAAILIGHKSGGIIFRHIVPNVLAPILAMATISLALAIITEATLSFPTSVRHRQNLRSGP